MLKENNNQYKKYISEKTEIRNWFEVTSNRKKVWNIQLWILEEIKKICSKHNIKFFADWWTLLGTIRHWGFIPRDDDTDICMLRKDYDTFLKIAPKELPSHLFLQSDYYWWWFSKIRDSRTAAIQENWTEKWMTWYKNYNQWIWVDIFPLDWISKFRFFRELKFLRLRFRSSIFRGLWNETIYEDAKWIRKFVFIICRQVFWPSCYKRLRKHYDNIRRNVLFPSNYLYTTDKKFKDKKAYEESELKKFETIKLPVPIHFDSVCKAIYWNDYMTPKIYLNHWCLFSVTKSYKDIKVGNYKKEDVFYL